MTKPLSYLNDLLCIESVVWDIQRNDELSGTGDGRVWQAELAPPLWTATFNVNVNYHDEIKRLAARIRALRGSQEPLLLNDPISKNPQFDKNGSLAGTNTITISSITNGGYTIGLNGFSPSFQLKAGDKFELNYGAGRMSFHEVSEDYTSLSTGEFGNVNIFPNIPAGVTVGQVAKFYNPACQMIIFPDSFNPGSASGLFTTGLTFRAIQKK